MEPFTEVDDMSWPAPFCLPRLLKKIAPFQTTCCTLEVVTATLLFQPRLQIISSDSIGAPRNVRTYACSSDASQEVRLPRRFMIHIVAGGDVTSFESSALNLWALLSSDYGP
jgi:hypothetical protein